MRFVTNHLAPAQSLNSLPTENIYFLSIINQASLYFKYFILFIIPITKWMSIDIHLSFPQEWHHFPEFFGFIAFLCIPLFCFLLLKNKNLELKFVCLGLIGPWLFFATEMAAARIMEPFVIYRSYLWLAFFIFSILSLYKLLKFKLTWVVLLLLCTLQVSMAKERLNTFESLVSVWRDAVEKIDDDKVPGSYRPYNSLGYSLLLEGESKEAFLQLEKSIAIQPDYHMSHFNMAWGLEKIGKLEEAAEYYKTAIAKQKNYTDAHLNLGAILIQLGKYNEAFNHLKIAEQLDPTSEKTLNNLGGLYSKLEKWNLALDYYNKVLKLNPSYAITYNNIGLAYLGLKKYKAAEKAFITSIN
ncbi:hypothetical protein BVY03_01035, partial [bacterium K02(2017)]